MTIFPNRTTIHDFTWSITKAVPPSTAYFLDIFRDRKDFMEDSDEISLRFTEEGARILYEKLKEYFGDE